MAAPHSGGLAIRSLNHISRVVNDVDKSTAFYRDVLGFHQIVRPECFDFDGSWLFNYGIGIHLIKGEKEKRRPKAINPKSEHLSFQCDNLTEVEDRLRRLNIHYMMNFVTEEGIVVSQVFFHDPDGNMIEICNCDCLPITLLDAVGCGELSAQQFCQRLPTLGGEEVKENRATPLRPTKVNV